MKNTWFISDTHFGHAKVLEYEPIARPFKTLEEMHEVMIDRWNSVVRDRDTVYHLGDFVFGRNNIKIAERLNGRKILIMGNHDVYSVDDYGRYFAKLYGAFSWKDCILSHVPVHPNQLEGRFKINVHGHLHRNLVMSNEIIAPDKEYPMNWCLVPDKRYLNVSVEQNNLTPIHADVILERLKKACL